MEFVCPDATATVRAANVRATLDAVQFMPEIGRKLIERHRLNIGNLLPDHFIPVQHWLDALKDLQREIGTNTLREVGRRIIENADFPPSFPNSEAILEKLDAIYYLNHRGNVGHYRVTRKDSSTLAVGCETPYPRYFEWGLIEGICHHRRAGGQRYHVEYIEAPPGGALTCTVVVRRW